jgi:hypothetical protein
MNRLQNGLLDRIECFDDEVAVAGLDGEIFL